MGFDRLSNFIIKNLNYNHNFIIDDFKRKILSNHVFFDLNFIIYNQMFELEEEVNNIIKVILNLPFSFTDSNNTDEYLQSILSLPWWKQYCENIEYLFDGNQEKEIINKFITFLTTKNNEDLCKINYMVIVKVIQTIENYIDTFHITDHLDTIGFFIDGIPSFSKILEQRRRRVKNYYESISKKQKINIYFNGVDNIFMEQNGIKYDYFKWLSNRFSYDKSISPTSNFIKKLEQEILLYFKKKYNKINILINSGSINGESDIKIFQHIQSSNIVGDIVIHTIDSDLIHTALIQQTYFLINRKDINVSIIRHNKENEFIQLYNGLSMVNCIMKTYNTINNNDSTDYRIIYDLGLILLFFGNDHLPSSFEIGPELGIDFIFKIYNKINGSIINLVNDKITFDFIKFKLLLDEFNKYSSNCFAKIFLSRNFKLPLNIISLLTDTHKMNLDFQNVLYFIKLLLIDDGLKIKDKLDKDDVRYKLILQNPDINQLELGNYINKFNQHIKEEINNVKDIILDNIDFLSENYFGLQVFSKSHLKTDDNYQDLYNILTENTINEINNKNSVLYEPSKDEYLEFLNSPFNLELTHTYMKKIYHLVLTQFGDLKNLHTNNITAYFYNFVPKIEHIIKYINENFDQLVFDNEIKNENINNEDYFNSVNHHIYITPYLKLEDIKDENIKEAVESLSLNNLWIDNKNVDEFFHNQVKPDEFLKEWSEKNDKSKTEINSSIENNIVICSDTSN